MERPDIAHALEVCSPHGLRLDPQEVSYFLSREKIVSATPARATWRGRLYAAMARNAASASDFFNVPANRVVELGARVAI